jgi:hypothetical protein
MMRLTLCFIAHVDAMMPQVQLPWTALHWVAFAIFAAPVIYPTGRILQRMGFSPFWSVIALIPFANLVGLWIVAIVPWPHSREVNGPDGTRVSRAV